MQNEIEYENIKDNKKQYQLNDVIEQLAYKALNRDALSQK
jgi:hypothetical protein|tara:strand:- start:696 stop:815 length:120 start_codon:yes stop_codon:yes gene_type:complete